MNYGPARKSNWRGIVIACAAGAVGTGVTALLQSFVAAAPQHLQSLVAAEAPDRASFAEVVDIVKPAVIGIRARVVDDDAMTVLHSRRVEPVDVSRPPRFRTSQGAGFFITPDGYAVTNNHVIRGSIIAEILTDGGQVYRAKVVGVDPASDLALLKVDGPNDFPHVQFSERPPRIGDWIIAIGNPFGLGGTVTAGIVSAHGRDLANEKDLLQIDAPVNRGNSGGPTFDLQGRVVGVNSMIISPTGASVGVAFAIPAATVRRVVEQLKDKGSVTRGWLDVQFQSVSPEVAAPLELDSASGVLIADVRPGGPGAAAGLAVGDIIRSINGRIVENAHAFSRMVEDTAPGASLLLDVFRHGTVKSIVAVASAAPVAAAPRPVPAGTEFEPVGQNRQPLGLSLAPTASSAIGESGGALVVGIDPSGLAAGRGIDVGDVILDVANKAITTGDDVYKMVIDAQRAGRPSILMRIKSGEIAQFVVVPLD
jgi:serine protease Do